MCINTMPLCTHVYAVRTIRQHRRVIVQDRTNVLPIFDSNRLVHRNSLHSLHSAPPRSTLVHPIQQTPAVQFRRPLSQAPLYRQHVPALAPRLTASSKCVAMSDDASSRAARMLAEPSVRDEVNMVSRGLDYVGLRSHRLEWRIGGISSADCLLDSLV